MALSSSRAGVRRAGVPLLAAALAVVLVGTLLALGSGLVSHRDAAHAASGRITGQITAPGGSGDVSKLRVALFDRNWNFIEARRANRYGIYTFGRRPVGTYWVQVSDRRPAYDVTKFATTDAKVKVFAGRVKPANLVVRRGAAITGTVRAGGAVASKARLVATNQYGGAYEVRANERGEFALGGLSEGNYSLFAYDRRGQFTGPSVWVPGMTPGRISNVAVALATRAGGLVVNLSAGGRDLPKPVTVTAVNRKTGQFWVARSRRSQVTLGGLHPGRYRLTVPGVGDYLSRTANVRVPVRSGAFRFTAFQLTRRGGWFTGSVVDATDGDALPKVTLSLYDSAGSLRDRTTSRADGTFRIGGSLGDEKQLTLVAEVPSGVEGQKYKRVEITGLRSRAGKGVALPTIALPRNGTF